MSNLSKLQQKRQLFQPHLPSILKDFRMLRLVSSNSQNQEVTAEKWREHFPKTYNQPLLSFKRGDSKSSHGPLRVGIVLSGGQAPGGHNVVMGAFDALKKINEKAVLIGFLNGPEGIIENRCIELKEEVIAPYRNQGGFDLIGGGRTKIETPAQFEAVKKTLIDQSLDGLIIVGGDDSNTNAALLAEFCAQQQLRTRIVGVPKTIDGDLKNEFIEISFGFDTASKVYAEIVGNLAKDCLSAKKYYFFVKIMGRSASHLALECALQTHVNMALIGEEILFRSKKLHDVVLEIADLIQERAEKDKFYGVVLIPEGLLEFIPECGTLFQELNALLAFKDARKTSCEQGSKEYLDYVKTQLKPDSCRLFSSLPLQIQEQLLLDRDPHGNIQLSKIETERLLIALVEEELKKRQEKSGTVFKFNPQPLFCGYEGRSALPSNFDCNYTYALGHLAILLILEQVTGYMCTVNNLAAPVEDWGISGVPLVQMMDLEMRKNKPQWVIRKNLVDLKGPVFSCFESQRKRWQLEDEYRCPGPIQFGEKGSLCDAITLTLQLEQGSL